MFRLCSPLIHSEFFLPNIIHEDTHIFGFQYLSSLFTGIAVACENCQKPVGQTVKVLSSTEVAELDEDGNRMKASSVEVTLEPNGRGVPHRHPGAVYGYVLEGEFVFKVEGKPEQTLKAGETFYEPKMILHEKGSNPSATNKTRVLAVIVHREDAKELVIMEPHPDAVDAKSEGNEKPEKEPDTSSQ